MSKFLSNLSSNSLNNVNRESISITVESDENFLKKILMDFYCKITDTNDFNTFEDTDTLIKWMKNSLENNDKSPEKILDIMLNHKESNIWLTSLVGFFYQHGI